MNDTLDTISANVRAEVARAGRTPASVIAAMPAMNRPKWQRRMSNPRLWTVAELQAIARTLNIQLDVLTKE